MLLIELIFSLFMATPFPILLRFQRDPLLTLYHHGPKVGKSLFADNQPCGCLRHFEIDRSGRSRKQASMPNSALRTIPGASTHFHDQSQN